MTASRVWKLLACALSAVAITAGGYFLDQFRAQAHERAAALQWARQLITQVESMELSAREKGEKDPLTSIVNFLTQGTEPRVMRMSRFNAAPNSWANPPPDALPDALPGSMADSPANALESFRLDRETGVFEYSRILNPETGVGIRIGLDLQSAGIIRGFLGSQSRFSEDLAIAAVFLISFFLITLAQRRKPMQDMPKIMNLNETRPASEALPWVRPKNAAPEPEVKSSVSALGMEIRDLVKQAYTVIVAHRNSQVATEGLKEKIHAGLNQLHSNRKMLREATQLIGQAENLANNPASEMNQKQLLAVIEKVKEISARNERAFREFEIQMEPWLMDAEIASEAYVRATTATEKMGEHIKKTKEKLIAHVRQIQSNEEKNAA